MFSFPGSLPYASEGISYSEDGHCRFNALDSWCARKSRRGGFRTMHSTNKLGKLVIVTYKISLSAIGFAELSVWLQ